MEVQKVEANMKAFKSNQRKELSFLLLVLLLLFVEQNESKKIF
jgi:hypothetical protein